MNKDQVLSVGMRIRAVTDNEPHYKRGEEFVITHVRESNVALDHCGCEWNSEWGSLAIRDHFELIVETPITPEESAKAISLPDPEDALKFFKRQPCREC